MKHLTQLTLTQSTFSKNLKLPQILRLTPELADTWPLLQGKHESPDEGCCAMELVAAMAGLPHSDHPACTCPLIASYVRAVNDLLGRDREQLRPYLRRLIGTNNRRLVRSRTEAALQGVLGTLVPLAAEWDGTPDLTERLRQLANAKEFVAAARLSRKLHAAALTGMAAPVFAHLCPWLVYAVRDYETAIRESRPMMQVPYLESTLLHIVNITKALIGDSTGRPQRRATLVSGVFAVLDRLLDCGVAPHHVSRRENNTTLSYTGRVAARLFCGRSAATAQCLIGYNPLRMKR